MRKAAFGTIALAVVLTAAFHAQTGQPLDVYFIDVEGGQATLFVSPSRESMLVDTGFPGPRDAARIADAAKAAGIRQLDYLVITH
jgi:beta-lactamase superfamily II metal-dependent hydrolase